MAILERCNSLIKDVKSVATLNMINRKDNKHEQRKIFRKRKYI